MKRTTTIGKMYAVTSAAGCTVTTPDGLPICTVEAGTQGYFTAPTSTVEVDDDAALLTATFKRAALALGLLGGGVKLPDGYNKYAHCTNVADLIAVNPDYKNDLTADGEWIYPLPSMVDFGQRYPNGAYTNAGLCKSSVTIFRVPLPEATNITDVLRECNSLTYARVYAPKVNTADYVISSNTVQEIELLLENATNLNNVVVDCRVLKKIKLHAPKARFFSAQRNPNLRVFDGELPSLETQSNSYGLLESKLDKASAIRILNSLPAYSSGTHRLYLGVHVDHQTDEEVVNAIVAAEEKGWTLTVRWNGTATAAAASTWGRRKPVFARLGEPMEDGTPSLDWGHYVTNAEENGYTEFASLEEAKEHFNITD